MKIKRVNKLLNDPSMQDRECNFKLTTKKPEAPQWFKEWSENVYEKRQPQWFKEWSENVYEKKQPNWFKTYMKEFEERINKRFDNLVTKNNLVE